MIGEYIGRVLLLVNKTPQFVVRDVYGRSAADVISGDAGDRPADRAQPPQYDPTHVCETGDRG